MTSLTRALVGGVILLMVAGAWLYREAASPTSPGTVPGASASMDPLSGLPWLAEQDLPVQARGTLRLIAVGGPFPYSQDGATFGNREGLLPAEPRGYYREYTVETPGSPDRGARRIIVGRGGERYWTGDHYQSFARVVQ